MPGLAVFNPNGMPGIPASTPTAAPPAVAPAAAIPRGLGKSVEDKILDGITNASTPEELAGWIGQAQARMKNAGELHKYGVEERLGSMINAAQTRLAPMLADRETQRKKHDAAEQARASMAADLGLTPADLGLDEMSDTEVLAQYQRDSELKQRLEKEHEIRFAATTHNELRPPGSKDLKPEQRDAMIAQMKEWGGYTTGDENLDDASLREAHKRARGLQTNIEKMDVATITDKIHEANDQIKQLQNPMMMMSLPAEQITSEIQSLWKQIKQLQAARDKKAGGGMGSPAGTAVDQSGLLDYLGTLK